jgi:hypothetical protein
MSLPNGSIANLLVTRKSLIIRNLDHTQLGMSLSCSVSHTDERIGGMSAQIKKSRRWKGSRRWAE